MKWLDHHRILWVLLLFLASVPLFTQAQQRTQYSQYLLNRYLANPAFGGLERHPVVNMGYSHQWTGFDGAPTSMYLSFELPGPETIVDYFDGTIPVRGRSAARLTPVKGNPNVYSIQTTIPHTYAFGGQIFAENTAFIANNGFMATYMHRYRLSEAIYVSGGAALGLHQVQLKGSALQLVDPNDQVFTGATANTFLPDLNIGAAFYGERFYLGAALNQLFMNKLSFGDVESLDPARLDLHYYINGGYQFDWNNGAIALTPSFLYRAVTPAPSSLDLSLKATFDRTWSVGASYRHKDAVVGMLSVRIIQLIELGYAYDFTTSNISNYSSGTHSIAFRWDLSKKDNLIRVYNW